MLHLYSHSSFSPKLHLTERDGLMMRKLMSPRIHTIGWLEKLQSPVNHIFDFLRLHTTSQCRMSVKYAQMTSFLSPHKITKGEELIKKHRVPMTLQGGHAPSKPEDDHNSSIFRDVVLKNFNTLYRFSRPHTVIGTIMGITSVSLLPVQTLADLTPAFFVGLLKALVPTVLMNIYVGGLNQLYDVEIDKVNKPDLPIASGDFSVETGTAIVSISLLMSLATVIMFQSPPLIWGLFLYFILGSVYSIDLPFLRWKRYPFLAAGCILILRALIIQLAFSVHMQKYVLGRPVVITRSLMFATSFMCLFSAAIAIFKDIPDVNGDKDFGIQSFCVRLGQKRVFWLCVQMLLIAYGVGVTVGVSSSFLLSKLVTIFGHCTLASLLWLRARSIDLSSKASITSFYGFIWKLFYAEYLLIPFVR